MPPKEESKKSVAAVGDPGGQSQTKKSVAAVGAEGPRPGGGAGFFMQIWLLILKNAKCTWKGDKIRLFTEGFLLLAFGLGLVVVSRVVPEVQHEKQTEPLYLPYDVLKGLEAGATRAPRVIAWSCADGYTEDGERIVRKMKAAYKRREVARKLSLVPLKFKRFGNLSEIEDAHNAEEDGINLGIYLNRKKPKALENDISRDYMEYIILAEVGNILSAPDANLKMTSLATCRQPVKKGSKIHERAPELPPTCPVNGYFYSGVLGLQYLLHEALFESSLAGEVTHEDPPTNCLGSESCDPNATTTPTTPTKKPAGSTRNQLPPVTFENFPKPKYRAEMSQGLRVAIPFMVVLPMANLINGLLILIVSEKESRVKDGLRMIGVSDFAYWISWFLFYSVFMLAIAAVFTCILHFTEVLDAVNPVILFLLFFFFGESVITFAFLLSPFFHKPKTAGMAGSLILMGASMLFLVQTFTPAESKWETLLKLLRILSSFALAAGLDEICDHEHEGGIHFADLFTKRGDRVGWSLVALVFDTCFYFLLAVYLDNIIPNEYGVRSHPLWFLNMGSSSKNQGLDGINDLDDNPNVEQVPPSMKGKEAIRIRNVRKTYQGQKTEAIKGISLDIYENQITAILGKNGAGKSTLFGILVGIIPPSKGKSIVFGLDTSNANDVKKLRKLTGVCLQNDLHFPMLTAREHLVFYGRMRGLWGIGLEKEVNTILSDLKISDKANAPAGTLSGGQKRKLSVGTAIIGDPKIILLDEPSAGVDPVSRRHLWSVLKKKKEGRVILLTTHFLDEADFLADRKAIINAGELKCHGSSLFLKHRFGVGYHVVIETKETYDEKACDAVFKKFVPGSLESKRHVGGKEVIYSLLTEDSPKFPDLFRDLEALIEKNKDFKSYGVSMTTLEEVFLLICNEELDLRNQFDPDVAEEGEEPAKKIKFNEEVEEADESGVRRKTQALAMGDEFNLIDEKTELEMDSINSCYMLYCMRWKRILRNWPALLFMTVFPVILIVIGVGIIARQDVLKTHSNISLDYPPDEYIGAKVAVGPSNVLARKEYIDFLKENSTHFGVDDYNGEFAQLLDFYHEGGAMAAVDFNINDPRNGIINYRFNGSYPHGPPIMMHSFAKFVLAKTDYPYVLEGHFKPFSSLRKAIDPSAIVAVFLICPAFTFPVVGMVLELLRDRETDARNYLRVCGVSTTLYFLPIFLVYSILSLFVLILELIILACFGFPAYTSVNAIIVISFLQLLSIPSLLLFGALFSLFIENVVTGQVIFVQLPTWLGTLVGVGLPVMDSLKGTLWSTEVPSDVLAYHAFFSFFDVFYLPFATFYWINKPYTICTLKNSCKYLSMSHYWGPEIYIMVIALLLQIPVFSALIYVLDVSRSEGNVISGLKAYFIRGSRRVKPDDRETKIIEMTSTVSRMREEAAGMPDEDVLNEKARIEQMWDANNPEDTTAVLVKDLRKTFYPAVGTKKCCRAKRIRVRALNGFSLAVEEGEVFGLLGHNGAGKSTAMKIIISEEIPDSGQIKLCGVEMHNNYSEVWPKVGYCSQTDPLWDNITFREHLELFAHIRGVPEDSVDELCDHFISGLQVSDHANQQVKGLSGGTKRKLTFAISMMGMPKIVLLDEPSTGLDPQSKRFLWNTILGSFKEHRGAILTTHSIEEAEILCSRIGIMQRGGLICIGSPQHLKSKYGKGYTLEIKLKTQFDETYEDPEERFAFVKENFPQSEISEVFDDKGVFSIPNTSIKSISSVFALLEKLKVQYGFEDYSFSQTTLEQIFLMFSKEAEEQEMFEASRTGTKKDVRKEKDAPKGNKPAAAPAPAPAPAPTPSTTNAPK